MPPRLRAPIVLVHGLLGYARLQVGGVTISRYFPGITEFLRKSGNVVLEARLSPTAGVAARAAQLEAFLDRELPGEPVHLLAHSMGGLDARYMISRLGMAPHVLSLTTIGTPHHGSPFADWGLARFQRLLQPALDRLGIQYQAFLDLATASCRTFNEQVPDAAGVRYFSVAGQFDPDWGTPEWRLPHRIVSQVEGPNDGVVSVASATYGESCEIWPGDHVSLVNWSNPLAMARGLRRDRTADYSRLLGRLADEGF